jgi:hypothetical protein
LGFGGNNGNNNNGAKTGAIHGPLMIDEGISLVAFRGFSLLGGWLFVGIFLLLFYILRYRWVCLIRHVCLSRIWSHSSFFFFLIFVM